MSLTQRERESSDADFNVCTLCDNAYQMLWRDPIVTYFKMNLFQVTLHVTLNQLLQWHDRIGIGVAIGCFGPTNHGETMA